MCAPIRCFVVVSVLVVPAAAQGLQVIYSEVAGHPSAVVPGARDAAGAQVFAEFTALEDLSVISTGNRWMLKARTNQVSTLDSILILGADMGSAYALVGNAFAQEGQPFVGGAPGERYDSFDHLAAWDQNGRLAFSARARGGLASASEKIVVWDGVHHMGVVVQMGDPALGLIDVPANPTGDELFGNSMNGLYLRNDYLVGFIDSSIQNCSSLRYPAYFLGHTSFRQSGVSTVGGEVWGTLSDVGGTPNGQHWFAAGDTANPNTAIDGILAVDDVVVLREGSPIGGTGPVVSDILFTRMLPNGDWFSRGSTPGGAWAVRNGVVLAKTGGTIQPGENWSSSFVAFSCNTYGEWVLAGTTTNPDPNRDSVLLWNGTTVLAREGDPVDLDGDGTFDDDAFLASFQPDELFLNNFDPELRYLYFLGTLRNGSGGAMGDVFVRLVITGNTTGTPFCWGDHSGFGVTPCPCGNWGLPGHGCNNSTATGGALLVANGTTSPDALVLTASVEVPNALSIFLQGNAITAPAAVYGDGVRCTGGALKRLYSRNAILGHVSAPSGADLSISSRSAALGDPITPGTMRAYQVYYRDPSALFCPDPPGNTWNVSNGVRVDW